MRRLCLVVFLSLFAASCGDDGSPSNVDASLAPDAAVATDAGLDRDAGTTCAPSCDGRVCGDDGCSGQCGTCAGDLICAAGQCVAPPACANGVLDPGEEAIDCGGPCPPCPQTSCTDADSPHVPADYVCIWNEEFGGAQGGGQPRSAVDQAVWTFQNLDVNGEAQNYTNRECVDPAHSANWNYCVEDGVLTLLARNDGIDCSDGADADNQPDNPDCALDWAQARGATGFTSGRVITKHKVAYQYGYIEFRARLPHYNRTPQSGLWPAIWLLGNNISEGPPPGDTAWPWCGEFDMMEWKSPDNHMGWNALWVGADDNLDACSEFPEGGSPGCGPCSGGPCTGVQRNGDRWRWAGWSGFPHTTYHTYGFLWTRDAMEVFIDGDKMSTFNLGPAESEFQQRMFVILNLAVGGSLGGAIQITDWTTASLEIDYVRWYQRGPD